MNAELNYILARERIGDLQRAAEQARLATDARTRQGGSRNSNPITRLSAQIARLTARLTLTGLREANDTARTPLAHDPVVDITTPTESSRPDVL